MEERLQKIISASGLMSRRSAEEMIAAGKVSVNGKRAELGEKADPDTDTILVNGKKLPRNTDLIYIMLNKPAGYVTTLSDEKGRKTVADLVSSVGTRLYPVGRLDLNSDGLLLMTNDGALANTLMHPSGGIQKVYRLTVKLSGDGNDEAAIRKLSDPIEIDGRMTAPAKISDIEISGEKAVMLVSINEGRNRQIRRLCENAGLTVIRLTRIAEGPVRLGKLLPGKFRFLTSEEIDLLKAVR
ncbi:MAG: pseudouridine synthase [Eubacteriales bacterium]|nr:pseudouridine synthase [Eubacteriales bacterium]